MKDHLPPAAQEQMEEIEQLQDEAEEVVAKKEANEEKLADSKAALDALDDIPEGSEVYHSLGKIRVKTGAREVASVIEDEVTRLEQRVETLEEKEGQLRERFENRKRDMKHLLGGATGQNSPGTDID